MSILPSKTLKQNRWPLFESHEAASCFNCGGDFGDGYPRESGYGRGRFEQHCNKCDHYTYYDVEPDHVSAAHDREWIKANT